MNSVHLLLQNDLFFIFTKEIKIASLTIEAGWGGGCDMTLGGSESTCNPLC